MLTEVRVNDGRPGDGQDVQLTTYEYVGGVYNRLEREFYGYATVLERHRDASNGNAVYRTVTRDFLNDSYYTRGRLRRELMSDGAGRPFTETIHTYTARDVTTPNVPADLGSTVATVFPQLSRTDRRF